MRSRPPVPGMHAAPRARGRRLPSVGGTRPGVPERSVCVLCPLVVLKIDFCTDCRPCGRQTRTRRPAGAHALPALNACNTCPALGPSDQCIPASLCHPQIRSSHAQPLSRPAPSNPPHPALLRPWSERGRARPLRWVRGLAVRVAPVARTHGGRHAPGTRVVASVAAMPEWHARTRPAATANRPRPAAPQSWRSRSSQMCSTGASAV